MAEDAPNHDSRPTKTKHDPPPTPHIHAHEHAHEHEHEHEHANRGGAFPHERLDAYRVALELAALAKKIAERIPRGHRSIADHLTRASSNTVLLLAEGANRRGAGLKRQRFIESRGECGETAAAGDLLVALELGEKDVARMRGLAARVAAMLTRLIERLE